MSCLSETSSLACLSTGDSWGKLRRMNAHQNTPTIDHIMRKPTLNLHCWTNRDVVETTKALSTGKFTHPRAKQMAAAARYGWNFTADDALNPEDWLNQLAYSSQTLSESRRREGYSAEIEKYLPLE